MQQFLVPQFIDVESKILGPITVRQFVILLVMIGTLFIFYKVFDFVTFLITGFFVLVVGIAFAFVKVNGMPFHFFVLNLVTSLSRPSLRVWRKENFDLRVEDEVKHEPVKVQDIVAQPRRQINRTRLSELSLVINTGGYYKGDDNFTNNR